MKTTMLLPKDTSWVILAGGQGKRMGEKDKGLILLNDRPLIAHVFERLSAQTSDIRISANQNVEFYSQFAPVIKDHLQGFLGPLGGIHAALCESNKDWVGFVPCDCPALTENLVERFCSAVKEESEILVAHDGQSAQPVFSLYHKKVLNRLVSFLSSGERKMKRFYQECNTQFVNFSDEPDCFINLNTPKELKDFSDNTPQQRL